LNYSVPEKYRDLKFFDKNHSVVNNYQNINYTIMDVSDPSNFEKFVNRNKVKKIYDHHP
jgi:hypothetical protein